MVGVGSNIFGNNVTIAHNSATSAVLWRKEMHADALRIHGGVVVIPVHTSHTVVLDVTTGHQLHTLPSAGKCIYGVCVFDGLTGLYCFFFFIYCHHRSATNEISLEGR